MVNLSITPKNQKIKMPPEWVGVDIFPDLRALGRLDLSARGGGNE